MVLNFILPFQPIQRIRPQLQKMPFRRFDFKQAPPQEKGNRKPGEQENTRPLGLIKHNKLQAPELQAPLSTLIARSNR